MSNFVEKLINKRNGNESPGIIPLSITSQPEGEIERGNMNQLGYTRGGRNNGDPVALNNSFQLIKSGQIVDENNNEQRRKETIEALDKRIDDMCLYKCQSRKG